MTIFNLHHFTSFHKGPFKVKSIPYEESRCDLIGEWSSIITYVDMSITVKPIDDLGEQGLGNMVVTILKILQHVLKILAIGA